MLISCCSCWYQLPLILARTERETVSGYNANSLFRNILLNYCIPRLLFSNSTCDATVCRPNMRDYQFYAVVSKNSTLLQILSVLVWSEYSHILEVRLCIGNKWGLKTRQCANVERSHTHLIAHRTWRGFIFQSAINMLWMSLLPFTQWL